MDALADPAERVAADTGFSGLVRVDRQGLSPGLAAAAEHPVEDLSCS
jgi:hypothetical protein